MYIIRMFKSIIDCFSRYLWLGAVANKQLKTVAQNLEQVYSEFGPLKIIQTDKGTEFQCSEAERFGDEGEFQFLVIHPEAIEMLQHCVSE